MNEFNDPVHLILEKFRPAPSEHGGRHRSGSSVIADVLGITQNAVNRWRHTGMIPAKYQAAILAEARRRRLGVRAEDLM
jgi:hypothetical protein